MSDQHLYIRRASAGSGKTYTLAAHYIALLLHGESYRSILAVTFTNKATAEMKERILSYLYSLARETDAPATQGFLARVRDIYGELGYRPEKLTDDYCRTRAEALFLQILSDYDGMRVSTIDAFLQSLLGGMIQMLGGAVGYQVELDTDGVIAEAVDQLLTKRAQDPEVCARLTRYMGARLEGEKHWDIRGGLCKIAAQLYREELQQHADQLVLDEKRLQAFREQVMADRDAVFAHYQALLDTVHDSSAAIAKVHKRMLDSMAGKVGSTYLFKGFTEKELTRIAAGSPEMAMHEEAPAVKQAYLYADFVTRHLDDLVLMNELRNLIQSALQAANSRLLGETAATLARTLHDGDADFILEKVGTRYRHIMLDEFQDTSSLQWENFRHLLEEILATREGSTLIVGDIKQSIYRWRNGDWTIMAGLDREWAPYVNTTIPALQRNFRSEKEVVAFNLHTMAALASREENPDVAGLYNEGFTGANLRDYYRAGHENGYVSLRCMATKAKGEERHATRQEILRDLFTTIVRLHEQGVSYREMMILLRYNKESAEIIEAMNEQGYAFPIVSNDCFELGSSPSVRLLIAAMRWIYLRDAVSAEYLRMIHPEIDPVEHLTPACRQFSLADLTEHLTRLYLCDASGHGTISDIAYLNSFKDKVRSYVATIGSDGEKFLQYWDEKLQSKAIPAAESDGIRMMTIHASKGLEAENVLIPFCDWPMGLSRSDGRLWCEVPDLRTDTDRPAILPIPLTKEMPNAGFAKPYEEECRMMRIDSLNMLYVAFTRAASRLYVWADATGQDTVADSLLSIYGETYTAGQENWEKAHADKPAPAAPKSEPPFRFADASEMAATIFSSEEHITFQQSQDSRKYGWNLTTTAENEPIDARIFGTICHDLLAMLGTYADRETTLTAAEDAIREAYERGLIPQRELIDTIRPLVLATVSDPQVGEWFVGDWRVLREEAVVFVNEQGQVEERRMDRVMWRGDEAIVLDYKFGQDDPKYDRQVRHYMAICRQMGARVTRGYLWIAQEQKLVEVK